MGSIITFYSYKGGVGRTMSLANAACLLANRGYRVLAVDWDLEAPGLHLYFAKSVSASASLGLIHVVSGTCGKNSQAPSWTEVVQPCMGPHYKLDLLQSGIGTAGYEKLITEFDWVAFYQDGGDAKLESLRDEWTSNYDFVLIDSRTGLTDSSGICTVFMPDVLVLVVTANQQSLDGATYVTSRLEESRQKLRYPRAPVVTLPLISRWDGRVEHRESEKWFSKITSALKHTVEDWLPTTVGVDELFTALRVPHVAYFSFGEKLPVLSHSLTDPELPGKYYSNLADAMEGVCDPLANLQDFLEPRKQLQDAPRIYLGYDQIRMSQFASTVKERLLRRGYDVIEPDLRASESPLHVDELLRDSQMLVMIVGKENVFTERSTSPDILSRTYDLAVKRGLSVTVFVFEEGANLQPNAIHLGLPPQKNQTVHFFSNANELAKAASSIEFHQRKIICLPYSSIGILFKGRSSEIEQLRARFSQTENPRKPSVSGIVIYGLGGVGKTRLAVEYCWQFADSYTAILFIASPSQDDLLRNLAALVAPSILDLADPNASEEEASVAAVINWLNRNQGWLLIIDGVDTESAAVAVEAFLAKLVHGNVLVTSRLVRWGTEIEQFSLDTISTSESAQFLLERTDRNRPKEEEDPSVAIEIANALGGLPLGIEQAGAYISQRRISLRQYIERWRSFESDVRRWHDPRTMKYPSSLAIAWQATINQLGASELNLLNLLSWLAPDPIPDWLLQSKALGRAWQASRDLWSEIEFDNDSTPSESIAVLSDYSMLRWDSLSRSVSMHLLVQEVVRANCPIPKRREWIRLCADVLLSVSPATVENVEDIRRWDELRPHMQACIQFAIAEGIDVPTTVLLSRLAKLWARKTLYSKAEQLFIESLSINEQRRGATPAELSADLNNLASLFLVTNRISEAEPLWRRALEIDTEVLGDAHPVVANHLNNLALLLIRKNNLQEAEKLLRRALEIDTRAYGEQHTNVSRDLSNLASLLESLGRLEDAEDRMRQSLAIEEANFGQYAQGLATSLNNLAQLLSQTGRLKEAESMMRRALSLDEQMYGPDHPNVAVNLNNLGQLLLATSRLGEAEALLRRSLEIYEVAMGPTHPYVSTALTNLAHLLATAERFVEAEPLMRHALAMTQIAYGEDHPAVATVLNNLASIFIQTDRKHEAEPLLRRALTIDEETWGDSNPHVAVRLNNLAQFLVSENREAEAIPLMERQLEVLSEFENRTGNKHPGFYNPTRMYVRLLQSMGLVDSQFGTQTSAILVRESSLQHTLSLSVVSEEFRGLRERLTSLLSVRSGEDFATDVNRPH